MILQEALEYLNLPANSSAQLVRKRFLELKKDYQKAINNAPSEHFSALYLENLNKIEEAYRLLTQDQKVTTESDSDILQGIQQVQQIVDTYLDEERAGNLNPEAQNKIQNYIDQISSFQDDLQEGSSENEPTNPSKRWDLKVKSPTENQEIQGESGQESGDSNQVDQTEETLATKSDSGPEESQTIDSKSETDKEPGTSRGWHWEIKGLKNKRSSTQKEEISSVSSQPARQRNSEGAFIEKWVIEIILNTSFAATSGVRKQYFNQLIMVVILAISILSLIGAIYILFPLL